MSDDDIRAALAEAIPGWVGLTHDEPGLLAAALLPVVEAYATRKAAEALRDAADDEDLDRRYVRAWLRARAAALTATHPDHGKAMT
jgi:hypothetical protein